ncbi:MAG TPA: BTAD domain-containing putative transcriptional regulator, partial [Gemmatimonadaceae bacterium]|nr:BTAD domain-containing putative transcriptional regulator [Gemmatimonadaceae bacterium]
MGDEGSAALRPRFNGFNTMRGGHFRLVTLGRLALERSDGQVDEGLPGLNARRRKVALLAVLALARHGVSRDTLIEMFWGDQDETRARHSLSDAVSHLRRVLGRKALVATRSTVTLSPSAPLVVDAVELAAAAGALGDSVDEGTTAACGRLVDGYTGPFLDGVHLEGSSTFEQWVAGQRAGLERAFVRAAALRCRALAAAREWAACEELAERWLDTAPLSAEAAVSYLEALAGSGDDGRVLAAYERLCVRLRREYELEPDPAVKAVAARVDARRRSRVVSVAAEVSAEGRVGGPPPKTEGSANPPANHHRSNAPTINPTPRAHYTGPQMALGLIGVVLIAAVVVAGANRAPAPPAHSTNSPVVAIAGIAPATSDTTLAWLADGLPQMLAAKLSRSTDVQVVPPAQIRAVRLRAGRSTSLSSEQLVDLGRRVGATVLVTGGVTRSGANAVLDLEVRTLPDGQVRRINVAVERDILALVDQAAVQLLGAIGSTGSGPSLAELETPSIAAYQHFTRYAQIASEGRSIDALPELDAAIAIDSAFTGALVARLIYAFQVNDGTTVATLT